MISNERSNSYEWQVTNVNHRKALIQKELALLTEDKKKFDCVTHLANYLSVVVSEAEIEDVVVATGNAGIKNEEVKPPISKFTLLKSVTYRKLLDEWMAANCKARRRQSQSKASATERRLRFELLELRNENTLLRNELSRKERILNAEDEKNTEVASVDRRDLLESYFIIEALLKEFEEFLVLQDGDLVVNNSLRRVLISSSRLQKYSRWHNEFNNSRYLGNRGGGHKN